MLSYARVFFKFYEAEPDLYLGPESALALLITVLLESRKLGRLLKQSCASFLLLKDVLSLLWYFVLRGKWGTRMKSHLYGMITTNQIHIEIGSL